MIDQEREEELQEYINKLSLELTKRNELLYKIQEVMFGRKSFGLLTKLELVETIKDLYQEADLGQ